MLNFATKHDDPEASLGWNERIGYASGGFAFNMINGIIGSFLTIYFTNVALLDAGIIATIIAVSKLFDGVSDLVVGNIVDRTNSKMGKGRTWLFRMCIPFAITTVLLFFVPQNFPTMVKYVYVFLMYNIVNAVCLTFMLVPYYSMISLITKNEYERGFLGNIQQMFQTLGNVVVNSFFVIMLTKFSSSAENIYTQQAFTVTMLIFCVVMVIASMICVFFTKERVHDTAPKEKKAEKKDAVSPLTAAKALLTNKYWVILTIAMFVVFFVIIMYSVGGVYYCQYVFNDMSQYSWMANTISVAQFATMFVTPFFMKKFGKTTVYKAGIGVMAVGFLGFGLFGSSTPIMMFCNVLKGCGLGMAGGMALGLVADTITYGRLKTGIDAVGMGNAGVSAAQKIGLGLGQAVFGWALSGSGFDASLEVQPAAVSTTIKFIYNWIPFVMCAVVFVVFLLFYHIDKDLPKLQEAAE
ncbi:MAG: MFS transporter [Lachnospiraceae bacterium]|nr:MFS transporter [Lachnospiraceae bacterium]